MPPQTAYSEKAGTWISEPVWPSANVTEVTHPLGAHSIRPPEAPGDDRILTLSSPLTVGLYAGKWCAYAAGPDLAGDQRAEDGGCLVFETEPLDEDLVILGRPRVDLTVTPDAPVAMVAARLSDVMPDGQAARVTYGLLNLCHRDGHEQPEPLAPGETHTARVWMNDAAKVFRAGHPLRLSLSTSYWPLAWPAPSAVDLRVHLEGTTLTLPVRRADAPAGGPFDAPRTALPLAVSTVHPGESTWRVEHDLTDGRSTLHVIKDEGRTRLEEDGLEMWTDTREAYSVRAGDFTSPRGETLWRRGFERDGWRVETVTRTVLTCDAERFYLRAELDAYEGDVRIWSKNWDEAIPRRLV
ncbi:CocE/NonD family hydrolase C-terminal non-catalytic domain-containing protein [uncultured Rhodospira sp.]|uniref:CocE/NonD family hydrolase C-terminal non-catalytic domain-containing protein n=1 Tax=uncultured Rhodospira sp. TaxID=1936189 RepID=UPI002610925E|nr:CocE/NonD family hydrolase C-terminal non-catalytic domain-containing protein [uncultured Rhodospira sp.]